MEHGGVSVVRLLVVQDLEEGPFVPPVHHLGRGHQEQVLGKQLNLGHDVGQANGQLLPQEYERVPLGRIDACEADAKKKKKSKFNNLNPFQSIVQTLLRRLFRAIDYGSEDGRFTVTTRSLTILNPNSFSSSETEVAPGIRS